MKQIALISGASGGIGREITACLAGAVDEVWLLGQDASRLAACAAATPCPARTFSFDMRDPGGLAPVREALSAEGVQVTWLVACAGLGVYGPFRDKPAATARDSIAVNCAGVTDLVHTALPYMVAGGHIVTLASAAAFVPQPRFAVYAASKSFVLSFSRALREELRVQGISVTAVCPGPVETDFITRSGNEMTRAKRRALLAPRRVAKAAVQAARRGHGVCIPGFSMKCAYLASKVIPHRWLVRFFG